MSIAKAAYDLDPATRPILRKRLCSGHFLDRPDLLDMMPPGMTRLERQHVAHVQLRKPSSEPQVLPVEVVGHHGPEGHAASFGFLDEFEGQLRLRSKSFVGFPFFEPMSRRVGLDRDGPVAQFIGPQARNRDDAVVDLADRAQVLPAHMRRLRAPFAISCLVDHQHAGFGRGGLRFCRKQVQPPLVDLVRRPGRLREKPLQPLGLGLRRSGDRFGIGQGRQRLVALGGQQKPFEVAAEGFALASSAEQIVEGCSEILQRAGSRQNGHAVTHGDVDRLILEEGNHAFYCGHSLRVNKLLVNTIT